MAKTSGYLIAIEGPDAAGKKTQSSILIKWFKEKGIKASTISFPNYNTPIGKEIQAFLERKRKYSAHVRHILFAANRWEKREVILRLLDKQTFVVVNRYTESNIVYGSAYGLDQKWLWNLELGMPKTDLVIVLDIGPKEIQFRRKEMDVYEKDISLQRKVRALYLELSERYGWTVIDGSATIDKVQDEIRKTIIEKFSDSVTALKVDRT